MWRVRYGPDVVYDPRDGELALFGMSGEVALNEAGSFKFAMPPAHPFAGRIELLQKDAEVAVEQDGATVFCGRAVRSSVAFDGSAAYECEGERAYLNDVTLPPYTTAEGGKDGLEQAPAEIDALFGWYVSQYNAKALPRHRFVVGVNEGAMLDPVGRVLRESSQRPAVWAEIKEKLVDRLGGYVRVRHEGGVRYIDYLADGGRACAQRIEFGVNLLDFARERDALPLCTRIVPVGAKAKDAEGNDADGDATIAGLPDGPLQAGYEKDGDGIVSVEGARRYGIVEQVAEFDSSDPEYLLQAGLRNLVNRRVGDTLELTAVDLHQVDPSVGRIGLGDYVRATSKPHGLDEHFLCWRVPFAPGDPGNCTYTLGSTYDVLTGRQSARIASLNESINRVYEAMEPIGQAAKDAAAKAEAAVVASWDEYALSESNGDPPAEGWSADTPEWREGLYVWRRAVTAYGDGTTVEGAPAVMTGGKGEKGEDATLVLIESSSGAAFKNNKVATTLKAVVMHGAKVIEGIEGLRAEYGPAARVEWSWQRLGEDRYGVISADDARLSDGGMALTVSPADVDEKTDFRVQLIAG